jgi:hypothetical protein
LPEEVIRFFYPGGRVKRFPAGRINAVGLALDLSFCFPIATYKKLLLAWHPVRAQMEGFGSTPAGRILAVLSQKQGVGK